jgi:hypothetical protein
MTQSGRGAGKHDAVQQGFVDPQNERYLAVQRIDLTAP